MMIAILRKVEIWQTMLAWYYYAKQVVRGDRIEFEIWISGKEMLGTMCQEKGMAGVIEKSIRAVHRRRRG